MAPTSAVVKTKNQTFCSLLYSKTGVYRVHIIFLIFAKNIDSGYPLEPPQRDRSNEYHNLCFEQQYDKYQKFYLQTFSFWW